ncbi:MAG: HypC/HybG/HupF family hydrogenase formation chaperone [Proteobacteria bacterium]|nr:HypC/HybG/HupF family hydrogenase formation chaperone [Pseudomonadota bacterium]
MPGKVVEINEQEKWAIIECFGIQNKVYTPLIEEDIVLGDYLMVHAGYAIGKIDIEEAHNLSLLKKHPKNLENPLHSWRYAGHIPQ